MSAVGAMIDGMTIPVWVGGWTSGWLFAATMVIVFFRFLSTGRLRTGREVDDLRNDRDARLRAIEADRDARLDEIRKDRDARLAEALAWKTAYQQIFEAHRLTIAQVEKTLPLAEVSAHVLASLPKQPGPAKEAGSDG